MRLRWRQAHALEALPTPATHEPLNERRPGSPGCGTAPHSGRRGLGFALLVTGGPPTDDKPGVTLAPPRDPSTPDHLFTIRVRDCRSAYETLRERGATFLTEPVEGGSETRCFFRDPDGHLFEISEYRG